MPKNKRVLKPMPPSVTDLAKLLRHLAEELQRDGLRPVVSPGKRRGSAFPPDGRYSPADPECQRIVNPGPGERRYTSGGHTIAERIFPLFLKAKNGGVFDPPHLAVFQYAIQASDEKPDSVVRVWDELQRRQVLPAADDEHGVIERMAEAFGRIGAGEPTDIASPNPIAVAVVMKTEDQKLSVRKAAAAVGVSYSTLQRSELWQKVCKKTKPIGKGRGPIRRDQI